MKPSIWARIRRLLPAAPLVISINVRRGRPTREEWLTHAVEGLRPLLGDVGVAFPGRVRVSVGFGGDGRRYERTTGGVCVNRDLAEDGCSQVFISPTTANEHLVLGVLLHELIHVSDNGESGHNGHFARVFRNVGFTGKRTGTEVSVELNRRLCVVLSELRNTVGRYPHAALSIEDL